MVIAKGTNAETWATVPALVSNSDLYDVLLGMDFLGRMYGTVHSKTDEFMWHVDNNDTTGMPHLVAKLPIHCRGGPREERYVFMQGEITQAVELLEGLLEDEADDDELANWPARPSRPPSPTHRSAIHHVATSLPPMPLHTASQRAAQKL